MREERLMTFIPDITESLTNIGVVQKPAPVLTKIANEILDISEEAPRLEAVMRLCIARIIKLYDFKHGIGIAAPQLGISKRAILFGEHIDNLHFLVNPRIVSACSNITYGYEGCLSCWRFRGRVPRSSAIKIAGHTASGSEEFLTLSGILARIAQHECDHLNGIIYDKRMEENDKLISLEEYAKLKFSSSK